MKKKLQFLNSLLLIICINVIILNAIASIPIQRIENQKITSLAPILKKVLPAVVSIHVEGKKLNTKGIVIPESLKCFFGQIPNHNYKNQIQLFEGIGSGVVIDENKGYILTNNHVVNGAGKIHVKLGDNREYVAKLIGHDEQTDIALITIKEVKNLTKVQFANSDYTQVGDFTIAIGNPFGLGQTVTAGIVSALGRNGVNFIEGLENFIQTDAAINKGNSGGALINLKGELIGINTAILTSSGGNIGIGFALPTNMIINFVNQLIKYGEIRRGQLGIKCSDITIDMAKFFNLNMQKGVLISKVITNSIAKKTGIKSGDIIVLMNNKPVNSFMELRIKIGNAIPGKNIKLVLIRNGKPKKINVIIDKLRPIYKDVLPLLKGAFFINGKTQNGNEGIKIKRIKQETEAYQFGLREDDIITDVNNRRIHTIREMIKTIKNKTSLVMVLNVIRKNKNIYLLLK
ncbi:serine endoprotease DegQ [Candidatus Pantoea edessiphila]|uniref:Serine endoprotease DegQ n=1 Tax=Candidatus Pantoea edessiphila TaxID=2044610 RepID=A0A2P5T1X2_9GAMM|nr:Do family serine endopeptidase [Candidatus Pantoea edessiphila]PPI88591.1 serine endoprotease DegQ [Candidatus Pantoea edessiphila]